jgi:spoIIIJ-associated protein
MSEYKEFQGKTLDEAIRAASAFYDAPREKLEIEIVSDAKAGIFGLVGVRKAIVKARVVQLEKLLDTLGGMDPPPAVREQGEPEAAGESPGAVGSSAGRGQQSRARAGKAREPKTETAGQGEKARKEPGTREEFRAREAPVRARPTASKAAPAKAAPAKSEKKRPAAGAKSAGQSLGRALMAEAEDGGDDLPRVPLAQLDQELLCSRAAEVVGRIVDAILGREIACTVACAEDRVRVAVAVAEDPGLLIGKDGQTLSSLQYLATRIVSNKMGSLVRVQVDAGDYRERQDLRLRELALDLAAKAKANNRPQLTRPLTSYQRRIIHVTLQDDPLVQTHSKGEGELKRVVVAVRRRQNSVKNQD